MSGWRALRLPMDATDGALEAAEAALERCGAVAIGLDGGEEEILEPAPGEILLRGRMALWALLPAELEIERVLLALAAAVPGFDPSGVSLGTVPDGDDRTEAGETATEPLHFGRLAVLSAPGPRRATRRAGHGVEILIPPGLGFGTGRHPTTALCLEALAARELSGCRVLDYGCGSGILAIAALALGAARAVAVDHDPQALAATRENGRRNRVASRLRTLPPEALRPSARFDLVLANILARPLAALAPRIKRALAPAGELVLSGLLADQAEELLAAYRPELELVARAEREGWVALTLRREARR